MEMYFLDLVDIVVLWYIVFPEPATFHVFWALHSQRKFFQLLSRWLLVNDCRSKRVSVFLLYFTGFETINFYTILLNISFFGSNVFF